jgi:hypothetical protein
MFSGVFCYCAEKKLKFLLLLPHRKEIKTEKLLKRDETIS